MTATTGPGLDALRARYGEAFGTRLPDHIRRLPWDAGRLAAHQRERLRALLACAIERSPFHARRLAGIDLGRFELEDLAGLPVMSKEQMMAGFDELATDRRITRARAEAHLMACADEPSLLAGLVQRLNQVRPLVIMAHTSKLALLAAEQHAGRLAIAPVSVTAMGEQLTETNRAAIGDAFGLPLINQFASTEGLVGHSDPGGEVLSFASDMCIAELVDQDNQPAPDGTPSAKVLLTNLYNHTWPLIRYELTDRFTRHPTGPGSGQLRATVEGRADDTFRSGAAAGDGGDRHRNRGAGRRDERERIWAAQKAACPGFADDERTTTRQVPVIVLEPARLSDGAPARCGAGRRPAAPGPGHFRHVRGGCRRWARHMASRQRRRSPERIYAPGSGCSRRARRSRHRPGPLVQAVTSRQHG